MHQIYVERVKKNATHTQKEVSIQKDCLIHKVDVQVFLIESIIQLWLEAFVIVPIRNDETEFHLVSTMDDMELVSMFLVSIMDDLEILYQKNH